MAVDESFFVPRTPVGIVAVGDHCEALVLRAILENLGAVVGLHLPGTPGDFVTVIGQGQNAPPMLIISGHGDEGGLIFGEYASEIDVSALSDGHLGAEAIGARANLPETVVISTACGTGGTAFASAFLDGGASAYIGPESYPDGADAVLFVHRLMHGILRAHRSLEDAFRLAQITDDPEGRFTLYGAGPRR